MTRTRLAAASTFPRSTVIISRRTIPCSRRSSSKGRRPRRSAGDSGLRPTPTRPSSR